MTMRTLITSIALVLLAASVVSARAEGVVKSARPVVIVFETVAGEGADKPLAASSTKALCSYIRDTQRVDAIIFDRESPTVLRAIMDKQLTADQVASYSSQQQRIDVAVALSYEYVAGAEISIKDSIVQMKVWMAKSAGTKKDRWEAIGQSATGGGGDRNYDNAMQSATSAAVISIARQAFLGLPPVAEKQPATANDTTAIGADQIAPPAPPSASDYAAQAEASITAGGIALAIQQYQQAINADPTSLPLRMKLASAYARKGMFNEASAEVDRASKMGASADQIAEAYKQIDALRNGQEPTQPEVIKTVKVAPEPATPATQQPAGDPTTAVGRIREGDKLWRESKPDEAAEAYKEAIKLNPSDWRAYERLALVDASMSLFGESRQTLEQLAKVQPSPSPKTVSGRYQLFGKVFEQWFATLFRQYDRDSSDYEKHTITRESYYSSIKSLGLRLESMAKFLDALPVPSDKQPASLHRNLALGLVSQAASSLQDYLETNNADSKSSAETFVAQAKKELDAAKKLEADALMVEKQPQPATENQPAEPVPSATPGDNTGQYSGMP